MGFQYGCMWTWLLGSKTNNSFLGHSPTPSAPPVHSLPGPASGCATWAVAQRPRLNRIPHLVSCFAAATLKFWIPLEQETLHFHFVLGPENYVASPDLALRISTQRKTYWEGQPLLKHLLGFVFDRRLWGFLSGGWPGSHNFTMIHFFIAKSLLPIFLKHCRN